MSRRHRGWLVLMGAAVGCLSPVGSAVADTIYQRDGSEMKGVIVEEFADRVTLSTESGEQEVLAQEIERVVYDTPEQNYLQLGDQAFDRALYEEAVQRYRQALTANPDFLLARQRLAAAQAAVTRSRDEALRTQVAQAEAVARRRLRVPDTGARAPDPERQLWERLGLAVESRQQELRISRVSYARPAEKAGIREGDRIVAVWGRLVKYTPPEEVMSELAEGPDYSELQLTLERDVDVRRRPAGMGLALRPEGLVMETFEEGGSAEASGLEVGDRIVSVGGQTTRYMPMQEVQRLLDEGEGPTVRVTLRRDVAMWRQPLAPQGRRHD